jgi:hypothetical protein
MSDPPEGIKVIINEEDISDIQAIIEGPGWDLFIDTWRLRVVYTFNFFN